MSSPAPAADADELERVLLEEERSCIFETRVERAAQCRDRGSVAFKSKDVPRAITWYERALHHVEFDEGTWHFEFMDKHRAAVNEVRLPVHLNLAMCYLQEPHQDLPRVIEHADAAVTIDPKNTKAMYRGGKAHLLLGNLDKARASLKLAAESQPQDRNIREALQVLADKTAEHKAREKRTWGGRLLDEKEAKGGERLSHQPWSKGESSLTGNPRASTPDTESAADEQGGLASSSGLLSPWSVLVVAVVTGIVLLFTRQSA